MLRRIALLFGFLVLSSLAFGQNASIGIVTAATLSGCTSNATYTLCMYGTSAAPGLAVSVSGGAFVAMNAPAGNPVLTVNGKPPDNAGNVTITAITTTVTTANTTANTTLQ